MTDPEIILICVVGILVGLLIGGGLSLWEANKINRLHAEMMCDWIRIQRKNLGLPDLND